MSHLFRDFKHTAWRLETRRGYASAATAPSDRCLDYWSRKKTNRSQWFEWFAVLVRVNSLTSHGSYAECEA
ncbi:DUF6879 family protein [Streptomyces dysideae]|uniref:DUF6879 family protein n=1 Tax=Streptomyces dysideae TaxID=909626 RepID=UPI002D21950C|nr:DUF6879 family protein [Streptomyces dysideae]